MKQILIAILSALTISLHGQTYQFEGWFEEATDKISTAKTNHLKNIAVYSYKNENDKRGRLYLNEEYDISGHILKTIKHQSHRYNETIYYSYNLAGRLIGMDRKTDFSKNYYDKTIISYKDNGDIKYIMSDFGTDEIFMMDTTFYFYDTLFYFYNTNGTIDFRYFSSRKDTIFHHYNIFGEMINNTNSRSDTTDTRIIDKNRCVIGNTDTTDNRIKITCDEMCNQLTYTYESKIEGKWLKSLYFEYRYNNNQLVEVKDYYDPGRRLKKNWGNLKLHHHYKLEYNDQGLLQKKTFYNRHGKVIEIRKYSYDYY